MIKNQTIVKEVYVSPSTRTIEISAGRCCVTSGNNTLQTMDVNDILDEDF